ncbi:MAG: hypothetical protein IAA97_02280 [Spirochaetes bacterium]|uniref:Uncharacterized protein n=1 Tax=Candidatus Ornithospirochaeta stercoripullorum TaxID=2840899 RepID=A0A9D9DZA9_9SPIO|nr:hypothetical protein [Candidatus Ornithospirochaeta stercoripullorum]
MAEKNIALRIAVAVGVSAVLVSAIAIFFLHLADAGSGFVKASEAHAIASELDGTEWKTNTAGQKLLLSLYSVDSDGSLRIQRAADDTFFMILSDVSTIVGPYGETIGGVLNGVPFRIAMTESKSGEGRAFSLVSDDLSVVFSQ